MAAARAQRRGTAWDDQIILGTTITNAATTTALLLAENVADPEKRGCTVVRVIPHLYIMPATVGVVSGVQAVSLGIGLVSDDAFAAGVFPEPNSDDDFPVSGWMYRDTFAVKDETLATGPIPPIELYRDLRVQRKLDRSSMCLMMINQGIEGSTFNVMLIGVVRVLYKLP